MPGKVLDEITWPFPNVNGCTTEVWEWMGNFITHITRLVITYSRKIYSQRYINYRAQGEVI